MLATSGATIVPVPTIPVRLPPDAYRRVADVAKAQGVEPDAFALAAVLDAASVDEANARWCPGPAPLTPATGPALWGSLTGEPDPAA